MTWCLSSVEDTNQSSYAAVNATFSDQTVNIAQGTTTATFTVDSNVDSTSYTDGYDALAQIDAANSSIPTGVVLEHSAVIMSDTVSTAVTAYRRAAGTDAGQIEFNVQIPADAAVGDNYATIVLDYSVDDYIESSDLAAIQSRMNAAVPGRLVNMQQLTSYICNRAIYDSSNNGNNANNTITLADTRNSQSYRVRKLADDKCWMVDNLALANTDSSSSTYPHLVLTDSDTNLASGTTFVLGGEVHDNNSSRANGICNQGSGTVNNSGTYQLTCDGSTTQSVSNSPFSAYTDPGVSGYGYFYNFYTATAGSIAIDALAGAQASFDICPKGWHLPTGGTATSNVSSTDFNALDIAYGGSGVSQSGAAAQAQMTTLWLQTGAFMGVTSGNYYTNFWLGNNVILWSSTVNSVTMSYDFVAFTVNQFLYPGMNTRNKIGGETVRCVV